MRRQLGIVLGENLLDRCKALRPKIREQPAGADTHAEEVAVAVMDDRAFWMSRDLAEVPLPDPRFTVHGEEYTRLPGAEQVWWERRELHPHPPGKNRVFCC